MQLKCNVVVIVVVVVAAAATVYCHYYKPFNATCSKLLSFEGFSTILV